MHERHELKYIDLDLIVPNSWNPATPTHHRKGVLPARGRVSPCELAWLAGLMDGEGAFYLRKSRTTYHTEVRIEMVDEPTIDKVAEILTRLGVQYTKKSLGRTNKKHRPRHILWLSNYASASRLVSRLSQYLVTKRQHAALVRRFADRRLWATANLLEVKRGRNGKPVYTSEDHADYLESRRINRRGV